MRQCDALDGLADGIINNYMACRAIFDVAQGARNRQPWAAKRCPNNVDPNPADTSAERMSHRRPDLDAAVHVLALRFATPLAHGAKTFGMWVPNTDPSGSGLILNARFRGQEGAADGRADARASRRARRDRIPDEESVGQSARLRGRRCVQRAPRRSCRRSSTRPTRISSAFQKRGGKMIVTIGTNDTLASPGAQLDYYQSVLDQMGRGDRRSVRALVRDAADRPWAERHQLQRRRRRHGRFRPRRSRTATTSSACCSTGSRTGVAPGMSVTVTAGERSLPLCSYPSYPRYKGGAPASASSYECAVAAGGLNR